MTNSAQEVVVEVRINDTDHRFEATFGGKLALLTFKQSGNEFTLSHTEVPEAIEGRGIASQLAKEALDYARVNDLTVIPKCPFVSNYIEKHPEYRDLLKK